MTTSDIRKLVELELGRSGGILRLDPAWVARDFLPPGKRLGLPEEQYNLGLRGGICERWLASTTRADNKHGVTDEGLSFLSLQSDRRVTLKEAVDAAPDLIMGSAYARRHKGLDRLAKIFDYQYRLPFHLHQMKKHAKLVGRNPKEEAYYFPTGVDMGCEPESYFGVHPSITEKRRYDTLLPYLVEWNSDLILRHSKAYKLAPDDGWHIPAGVLHAPGSALTIELQEDSDVFAMMQALTGRRIIDKELLFKDVRPADRKKYGEKMILTMVDWKTNGDHYFYEHRHTPPVPVKGKKQVGGEEYWIFYNTKRFSGKKLVVKSGGSYSSVDRGVYSILVWQGTGSVGGQPVEGGRTGLDELLVSHAAAVKPIRIENTGPDDLVLFKFFGPDVNPDVPMLKRYPLSHSGRGD